MYFEIISVSQIASFNLYKVKSLRALPLRCRGRLEVAVEVLRRSFVLAVLIASYWFSIVRFHAAIGAEVLKLRSYFIV